ncbi:phage tail tape measure protein [Ochrobactrum teleogrylli]|uniref:Phage tail tape measure protein domain-containing protein n=1 Tax=Ochrobactrum teleogrylli TaxID=2479765 RepID=A0ABY2Y7Z6_9HYPH|nr:phage tail tape measure protein [[Ochrobactrum] teleogrylli]TNV17734.1 hypothetical protein FIC94_06040 [[Ochrobactrum] teleogrylli]
MASKTMALDVLVRLRDQLSGPMRRLRNGLQQLSGFARRIGVLGTAIAAISFMGPVQEAAAFQQQLLDIAGTAELSGKAAFDFAAKAKVQYEDLALAVGQMSETVAAGAGQMIAAGVDRSLIDATLGDIGRAATAANAEFSDMAGVTTSLLNNLKVPADQIKDSLGALVMAGKAGSFELKDMAKYFPQLTSQAAKFGVKGREAVNFLASSLQIAMKGASDPSVAANNFNNFLSKALAPMTQKNFAKMGVDIQAVMQDAASKGINPLEAMLQKVGKLTGVGEGDIAKYMKAAEKNGLKGADAVAAVREQLESIGAAGKIGKLFGDQQVLDFLIPFLANVEEYKDIKKTVAAATGAAIDADFETQMAGDNRQLAIFREIGTQAVREVGSAFASWLPTINPLLMSGMRALREFDQATGGWVKTLLTGAGGVVLLVGALGALGVALPIIGAGLGAIGALIGVLLSPLGVVIGLMAGGAFLVWRNWETLAPKFKAAWTSIQTGALGAWARIKTVWGKAAPYLQRGWERLKKMGGQLWDGLKQGSNRAWTELKTTWSRVQPYFERAWSGLKSIGARLFKGFAANANNAFATINWDNLVPKTLDAIYDKIGKIWEGYKAIWEGIAPSFDQMGKNLQSAFSNFGDAWSNLERLASALGQLIGFKDGAGIALREIGLEFGKFIGKLGEFGTSNISTFAWAVNSLFKGLADLAEWAAGKQAMPNWMQIFPDMAGRAVNVIASGVEKLWGLLQTPIELPVLAWDALAAGFEPVYNKIKGWLDSIVGAIQAVKAAILGVPDDVQNFNGKITGKDARDALNGNLVVPPLPDLKRPPSANSNDPEKRASLETPTRMAAIPSSQQSINVGGDIRIKVDGPGKVVGGSSDNKRVPITTDRGRSVGLA